MILKEVVSGNSGLIGILDNGEEGPLSAPTPSWDGISTGRGFDAKDKREFLKEFKEKRMKSKKYYYQLGNCVDGGNSLTMVYNTYQLRK